MAKRGLNNRHAPTAGHSPSFLRQPLLPLFLSSFHLPYIPNRPYAQPPAHAVANFCCERATSTTFALRAAQLFASSAPMPLLASVMTITLPENTWRHPSNYKKRPATGSCFFVHLYIREHIYDRIGSHSQMTCWRERVGIEPTKDRTGPSHGFEDQGAHQLLTRPHAALIRLIEFF